MRYFWLMLLCSCASQQPCTLPAIHHYSVDEQIKIAMAHNQLPADSPLRPVLEEWETLRRELK